MILNMKLDVKLSRTEQERLLEHIQEEITRQLLLRLKSASMYFQQNIQYKIKNMLEQSSEFQELISGKLRFDMGITTEEALSVMEQISDIIIKTLKVEVTQGEDGVSLTVNLIKEGYKEILSIKAAKFIQTFTRKSPYEIPWLQWLLLEGDKMIVADYHIRYEETGHSRSGGAIMVKKGSWRVPPEFAGTAENNIITRAFLEIDEFIYQELQKFL